MGDCIDKEGHDYDLLGYMVVAEKLPEKPDKVIPCPPITGTTVGLYPLFQVPLYFAAKIEVHQCKKCGEIKLQQAVFSRILEGDKKK